MRTTEKLEVLKGEKDQLMAFRALPAQYGRVLQYRDCGKLLSLVEAERRELVREFNSFSVEPVNPGTLAMHSNEHTGFDRPSGTDLGFKMYKSVPIQNSEDKL